MRRPGTALFTLVAGAVAVRLPAFLASRHLGFDDGVYGASAVAMRHGAIPFRQVFSSQGPLFLPLVWVADLIGLRRLDSPRLLSLTAAAGIVLATYAVARAAAASQSRALVAAALAGTSGAVLWVSGPLTSDGVAVALATTTVALALRYRQQPSTSRAVAIGLAAAATLSVKSLLVGLAVPVGWALWSPAGGRRTRDIGAAVAVALAAGFLIAVPFGIGRVWDQSVRYHLDAAGSRTPVANVGKTSSTIVDRDLPLLVAGALAAGCVVLRRTRKGDSPAGDRVGSVPLVVGWLVATAVVLVLEHPLWRNHVAHLAPAAAVLIALRPPPPRWLVAALAVTLPWHVVHNQRVLWPRPYGPRAALAVHDLRSLRPGAWAISDEPGLVFRAGRRTPPDLVDASRLRIDERRITTESLVAAARDQRVCTVLVWSRRFGRLPGLPEALQGAGFVAVRQYDGGRTLFAKNRCLLP
jgi:hypothetical protein